MYNEIMSEIINKYKTLPDDLVKYLINDHFDKCKFCYRSKPSKSFSTKIKCYALPEVVFRRSDSKACVHFEREFKIAHKELYKRYVVLRKKADLDIHFDLSTGRRIQ